MQHSKCQIYSLDEIPQPLSVANRLWQFRNRVKRLIKRRCNYIFNWFAGTIGIKGMKLSNGNLASVKYDFQPGDLVRIKSKREIQATLNKWNQLKGCAFMEEMWQHCGTEQKVFKLVRKFLDERDYLMKNCNGILILEGVFCEGTKDFGPCDRSCFYFWRTEWLEKA